MNACAINGLEELSVSRETGSTNRFTDGSRSYSFETWFLLVINFPRVSENLQLCWGVSDQEPIAAIGFPGTISQDGLTLITKPRQVTLHQEPNTTWRAWDFHGQIYQLGSLLCLQLCPSGISRCAWVA